MKRNYRRGTTNQTEGEGLRAREAGNKPEHPTLSNNFYISFEGFVDPQSGRLTRLEIHNDGMEIRSISSEKGHFMFEGIVETPRVTQLLKRITE